MPTGNSNGNRKKERTEAQKAVQFKKGQSGNPSGRPKKDPALVEILVKGGPKAAQYMLDLLENQDAKDSDRQRAAEYILDRLMGKATQPIQADMFLEDKPVTLGEMLTMAREVVANAEGGGDGVP